MRDDEPTRPLQPSTAAATPEPLTPAQLERGETLPAEPPGPQPSSPALRLGTRVGRYLLEDVLGRGGMGVVYAAHDPELDRRIAIKLVRTRTVDGSAGRARLVREAQAMARLAHPNVIAVFDVGTVGDDVFIAMELSTGGTLRAHQRDRGWDEIVRAYVQAGRGLAAAHAAGLVHRDFKPDNVLVGADGRLRVTDFGLVRAADAPSGASAAVVAEAVRPSSSSSSGASAVSAVASSSSSASSSLTEVGSVMGTPTYMAPEQMVAGELGPAADQFAFAVALWQALHGASPFVAEELAARRDEILAGTRRAPTNRAVPARIQRALERALAGEPSARWPSLTALLDELDAARAPRRARLLVPIAAGTVTVAAVIAIVALRGGDAPGPCAQVDRAGVGLWSRARPAVERAFAASGAAYADASFRALDGRLVGLERDWRAAAIAACRDTRERAVQPEPVYAQRQACLEVRRQRAATIIANLSTIDRDGVADIAALAASLPRLDECADPQVLAGLVPRPAAPDAVIALTTLEATLATRAAQGGAGDPAADDAALAEARRLGYPPIEAEALLVRARHAIKDDRFDAARKDLIDAAAAATRGGDRGRVAEAYLELLELDAGVRGDLDGAASWNQLAAAAVDALGRPLGKRLVLERGQFALAFANHDGAAALAAVEPLLAEPRLTSLERFELEEDRALALIDLGRFDEADRALAALEPVVAAEFGVEHPLTLSVAGNRASVLYHRGEFAACRAAQARQLASVERVFGAEHVRVATALEALASCENKSGKSAEALAHFERAVAILRTARGPAHPRTLSAMSDLAGAYSHLNQHRRALEINQELLAIRERTLGAEHLDVAVTLVNLAIEAKNTSQLELALASHQRALAIFERALGKGHPNVAIALINQGEALRSAGRYADALAGFERAGAILTDALGAEHILLAHVHYGLGMAELGRGSAAAAVPWLERAVARRAGPDQDPNEQAEAELGLAQALVAAHRDRARARTLAEHAIATWTAAGAEFADKRAAATTWLATVR